MDDSAWPDGAVTQAQAWAHTDRAEDKTGRAWGIVEAHRQAKEHGSGSIRTSLAYQHPTGHVRHMPDVLVGRPEGGALMPRKLRELRVELAKGRLA